MENWRAGCGVDPTLCPFPSGLPSVSMDATVTPLSLAIKTAFRSLLIHGNQNGAKIEKSPSKRNHTKRRAAKN